MEGKVSIFPSGKMISIGTKSVDKAIKELKFVAKTLNTSLKTTPKIQSIVATADLSASIDLQSFLNQIQKEKQFHAIYEPEQFPEAIKKFEVVQGTTATVLLFSSGKLVRVGLTRTPKTILSRQTASNRPRTLPTSWLNHTQAVRTPI